MAGARRGRGKTLAVLLLAPLLFFRLDDVFTSFSSRTPSTALRRSSEALLVAPRLQPNERLQLTLCQARGGDAKGSLVVIAGPPAAGKGTQCEKIKELFVKQPLCSSIPDKYGFVHISTGDILRDNVKKETELGKKAKGYMDSGALVPSELIVDLVKDRLMQEDVKDKGCLLDGFPRAPDQAEAMVDAGLDVQKFLVIKVPDDTLVERGCGRRSDPETGEIYHLKFRRAACLRRPRQPLSGNCLIKVSTLRSVTTAAARLPMLRAMVQEKRIVRVIEVHSGFSALVVDAACASRDGREVTFDCLWSSSLTSSAIKGKPDIETVTTSERLHIVDDVLEVSDKPILYDGDTGGAKEIFAFTVRKLERLGVSGVVIEDKCGLKQNSLFGTDRVQTLEDGPLVRTEDVDVFCDKIRTGKDAQVTRHFMIFARLEALIAGLGEEECLQRARAYVTKGGADGIMIHSKEKEGADIFSFMKRWRQEFPDVPVIAVPTTYNHAGRAKEVDSQILPTKKMISLIDDNTEKLTGSRPSSRMFSTRKISTRCRCIIEQRELQAPPDLVRCPVDSPDQPSVSRHLAYSRWMGHPLGWRGARTDGMELQGGSFGKMLRCNLMSSKENKLRSARPTCPAAHAMVYINDFEEFEAAAQELFSQHPLRTRYLVKYRHKEGKAILKVTNDRICLKFRTELIAFLKRIEKFSQNWARWTVTKDLTKLSEPDEELEAAKTAAKPTAKAKRRKG
eukprot:s279_g20.t1